MSIKSNVVAALNSAAAYGQAIKALKADCAKLDREAGRAAMLPAVAEFYGVALVEGQKRMAGQKVLDTSAAKYEAAKTAIRRLVSDVYGPVESSGHKATVKAPKALTDSIVEQIIAAGITKAEFKALLEAVRDGVSFE